MKVTALVTYSVSVELEVADNLSQNAIYDLIINEAEKVGAEGDATISVVDCSIPELID